jgi:hypothetical protein
MKRIISVILIALMVLTMSGCGGGANDSSAFSFTGSVELNGVGYDVTMSGESDGSFTLSPGNIPPINGTYEFTEGKGYLFKFGDSVESEILTYYDEESKEFSIIYPLNLGPRGNGNVKLSCKDESFEYDNIGWEYALPVFVGEANFFDILIVNLQLQCKSDGTFKVHNDSSYAQQMEGNYTFSDDVYSFTVSESNKFESVYDEATGLSSVTFMIEVNNVPVETTLTERVLEV